MISNFFILYICKIMAFLRGLRDLRVEKFSAKMLQCRIIRGMPHFNKKPRRIGEKGINGEKIILLFGVFTFLFT